MNDSVQALSVVDAPDPWEQLPEEPDDKYQAFLVYLNHPSRRMREVWRQLQVGGFRCAESSLYAWRDCYNWQIRARAWTQYDQQRKDAARLKGIEEMNARHVNMAGGLLDVVEGGIQAFKDDPEKVKAAKLMELGQVATVATQIHRKAMGVADQASDTGRPMFQIVIHTGDKAPRVVNAEDNEQ